MLKCACYWLFLTKLHCFWLGWVVSPDVIQLLTHDLATCVLLWCEKTLKAWFILRGPHAVDRMFLKKSWGDPMRLTGCLKKSWGDPMWLIGCCCFLNPEVMPCSWQDIFNKILRWPHAVDRMFFFNPEVTPCGWQDVFFFKSWGDPMWLTGFFFF